MSHGVRFVNPPIDTRIPGVARGGQTIAPVPAMTTLRLWQVTKRGHELLESPDSSPICAHQLDEDEI